MDAMRDHRPPRRALIPASLPRLGDLMLNMTRFIVPLAVFVAACGGNSSTGPVRARTPDQARRTIGLSSRNQGIDDIITALNDAWVAKSAEGYAASYAEDAQVITPVGTILAGRAAVEARHAVLFAGPLANSSQVVSITRVQFLTGTIAIVDANLVLTGFVALPPGLPATEPGVSRQIMRWVMTKASGTWEIAAQESTPI